MVLIEVVDLVVHEHRARDELGQGYLQHACGVVTADVVVTDLVVFDPVAIDFKNNRQRHNQSAEKGEHYDGFGETGDGLPGLHDLLLEFELQGSSVFLGIIDHFY